MKNFIFTVFLLFSSILVSYSQVYRVKELATVYKDGDKTTNGIETEFLKSGTLVKLIKPYNQELYLVSYNDNRTGYIEKVKLEITESSSAENDTVYFINSERSLLYSDANRNSKTEVVTASEGLFVVRDYDDTWVNVRYKKKLYYIPRGALRGYKPHISTPTKSAHTYYPSTNTIHTGPKGGKYYINSNGNKTYIKK